MFANSHYTTDLVSQVNGTLVTHSNHIEVVKLIKCKFLCLCSHILKTNLKVKLMLHFDFLFFFLPPHSSGLLCGPHSVGAAPRARPDPFV